jgi:TRAP-type transport system small permease protein
VEQDFFLFHIGFPYLGRMSISSKGVRNPMRLLDDLYRGFNFCVGLLIVLFTSLMVIDVNIGVFCRYVLNDALSWTEELSRYLMVWMAYLGMSIAVRDNQHMGLYFIAEKFSPRVRSYMEVGNRIVVMIFLGIVFRYSLNHLRVVRIQSSPSMEISMFWPYLSVTVGMGLMMLENLRRMILIKFK